MPSKTFYFPLPRYSLAALILRSLCRLRIFAVDCDGMLYLNMHHVRSDGSPRTGEETSLEIEALDAAGTMGGSQGPDSRADVGLAADSVVGQDSLVGEAALGPPPDAERPLTEVTSGTNQVVANGIGHRPGDEVGGASPVDQPGGFCY